MLKQRFLFLLFLLIPLFLFGQSVLTHDLNMFRDGDELKRFCLQHTALSQRGEDIAWDLSGKNVQDVKYRHRYAAVPDTSLLSCVEGDTRYYYDCRGDSLLLLGFENNQTRLTYVLPVAYLRFPFQYGDSIGVRYEAFGTYCDREALHVRGRYKSVADGTGTLILPDGDTLKNVLRIRTYCSGKDMVSLRGDSVRRTGRSIQVIRETLRWYVPGYRYPVLESVMTGEVKGKYYHSLYLCPPEEQASLPLDESNRRLRETSYEENDGNGASSNNMREDKISYRLRQNHASRSVTIEYDLREHAQVDFILSDSRGIVYRRLSRTDDAGSGYTAEISYNGLRRGQYVLYICTDGVRHGEKFNVQ